MKEIFLFSQTVNVEIHESTKNDQMQSSRFACRSAVTYKKIGQTNSKLVFVLVINVNCMAKE